MADTFGRNRLTAPPSYAYLPSQTPDGRVIVGADNGSILLYTIEENPDFSINLTASRLTAARKPIEQLCVVPYIDAIAILSGQ
ncbi:hypothetical protein HKX48_006182 [Thoreauomyces humboldtii]|nr:hypothetical protein HKX48_006182 [Thoreauomyces humboldtii]